MSLSVPRILGRPLASSVRTSITTPRSCGRSRQRALVSASTWLISGFNSSGDEVAGALALAIELAHARDGLADVVDRATDDSQLVASLRAHLRFRLQQRIGVERDRRDRVVDVVSDAARHLAERAQPLLLQDGVLALAQILIGLLQPRVQLRLVRGERDVLAELPQELAIAAAETLAPRCARPAARRTPGSPPAAAPPRAHAIPQQRNVAARETATRACRARRPARPARNATGRSARSAVCRRARAAAARARVMPFGPMFATVSLRAAASYMHMHAKSIGMLSSRLRTTTWKMLSRSWRSPMACVARCNRSSLATWLRSLRCVASRSLQGVAQRVVLRLDARQHLVERSWSALRTRRRRSTGARTLKSPRSETALAVSVSDSTGCEMPAWKMRDRKYASRSEATIAAAAIAPHNQNLAYSALVSARMYKVPRRRLGPSLTGSNPSRRPALKL